MEDILTHELTKYIGYTDTRNLARTCKTLMTTLKLKCQEKRRDEFLNIEPGRVPKARKRTLQYVGLIVPKSYTEQDLSKIFRHRNIINQPDAVLSTDTDYFFWTDFEIRTNPVYMAKLPGTGWHMKTVLKESKTLKGVKYVNRWVYAGKNALIPCPYGPSQFCSYSYRTKSYRSRVFTTILYDLPKGLVDGVMFKIARTRMITLYFDDPITPMMALMSAEEYMFQPMTDEHWQLVCDDCKYTREYNQLHGDALGKFRHYITDILEETVDGKRILVMISQVSSHDD